MRIFLADNSYEMLRLIFYEKLKEKKKKKTFEIVACCSCEWRFKGLKKINFTNLILTREANTTDLVSLIFGSTFVIVKNMDWFKQKQFNGS